MARVTAEQFRKKHAERVSGSVEYVKQGVNRVTEAPGKKAAAKADKAKAGYVAAIETGKWAKRVASVSLDDWKTATLAKADRIPSGVEAAADKILSFAEQLLPFQDKVVSEINTMPDLTPSQRDQRMLKNVQRMREFSFNRG